MTVSWNMNYKKTAVNKTAVLVSCIWVSLVSLAQQIINAGMVELRQLDQYIGWNIPLACFVVRIADLAALEKGGQVFLQQVMIFSQLPNPSVHNTILLLQKYTIEVYIKQIVLLT